LRRDDEVDASVTSLLDRVVPVLGTPTCRAGCDACCRHSVRVTSAEGLRILEYLARQGSNIEQRIIVDVRERAGRSGRDRCVLLRGGLCSVYPARPAACRTQLVWHEARYCDAPNVDVCTPAELLEIRYLAFLDDLIDEANGGRMPFSGELGAVLAVLDEHANAYRSGARLQPLIGRPWLENGSLQFPTGETPAQVIDTLRRIREREAERFRNRPAPLGMPRALGLTDRAGLGPFFLARPARLSD
jgi:Fe-S-cluster containining protein